MTKKMLLITIMFALAITGLVMSPVKGSLSSLATSEVSITQNVGFADKVSVSVEKQVEITQEFGVEDSMLAQANVVGPASPIWEIMRRVVEQAVSSFQEKIITYGPVFWQGNHLIKFPDWPWIPVGIILAILGIVTIEWRRLSHVLLIYSTKPEG